MQLFIVYCNFLVIECPDDLVVVATLVCLSFKFWWYIIRLLFIRRPWVNTYSEGATCQACKREAKKSKWLFYPSTTIFPIFSSSPTGILEIFCYPYTSSKMPLTIPRPQVNLPLCGLSIPICTSGHRFIRKWVQSHHVDHSCWTYVTTDPCLWDVLGTNVTTMSLQTKQHQSRPWLLLE